MFFFWIFYSLVDFGFTKVFNLDSKSLEFGLITAIFGFLTSIVFFYWLITSLFIEKRNIQYFSIGLFYLSLITISKYYLLIEINEAAALRVYLIDESIRWFHFFIFTSLIWAFHAWVLLYGKNSKTEKKYEELSIAHQSLQLSPHFLMNIIGSIAGKSRRYSEDLFKDITHYTNILSYAYQNHEEFNSLAAEINTIISFLHSQRLRFGKELQLIAEIDEELLEKIELTMPKMLLLTLIENCFKHGEIRNPLHPIQIKINWLSSESHLTLFTQNKIKENPITRSTKFGLTSIKRLLKHHFPASQLVLTENPPHFTVKLSIPYEESS